MLVWLLIRDGMGVNLLTQYTSKVRTEFCKPSQVALVTGGAAAGGTLTIGLLGFGASTPDWKALREDIADLINDPDVKNPSCDDGVQGEI